VQVTEHRCHENVDPAQVPRLAGQGEENHPAHPGMGNERLAGRHLLPFGLLLGQEARGLHLPQRELLKTSGTHLGRPECQQIDHLGKGQIVTRRGFWPTLWKSLLAPAMGASLPRSRSEPGANRARCEAHPPPGTKYPGERSHVGCACRSCRRFRVGMSYRAPECVRVWPLRGVTAARRKDSADEESGSPSEAAKDGLLRRREATP
jgi:hypothetical protein